MATKRTTIPRAPRSTLKATDVPGVYRNRVGALVDSDGVLMAFKNIKKADDDRFTEVLGNAPTTPLDVMTGVAMDPRNPMHVRLDAAKHATPYIKPKLVAVQGVAGAAPINVGFDKLDDAALTDVRRRLEELAVLISKGGAS